MFEEILKFLPYLAKHCMLTLCYGSCFLNIAFIIFHKNTVAFSPSYAVRNIKQCKNYVLVNTALEAGMVSNSINLGLFVSSKVIMSSKKKSNDSLD